MVVIIEIWIKSTLGRIIIYIYKQIVFGLCVKKLQMAINEKHAIIYP